jgi:hypothetical protein
MSGLLADAMGQYAWRPFINQPPLWEMWYLLLVPLCAGVSIVYKSVKCRRMQQVPREALVIFAWIIFAMLAAAAVLAAVVWWMSH